MSSKEQGNVKKAVTSFFISYILIVAALLHIYFFQRLFVVFSFSVLDFTFLLKNSSNIRFTEKPCSVERIIMIVKIRAMCMTCSLKI